MSPELLSEIIVGVEGDSTHREVKDVNRGIVHFAAVLPVNEIPNP